MTRTAKPCAAFGEAWERTEQGKQILISGVKPITERERLMLLAAAPMSARKPQNPLNIGLAACPPAREAGPGGRERPEPVRPFHSHRWNQQKGAIIMKTYRVLYAEDVPHYGITEIQAEDDNDAIEKARTFWRDKPEDRPTDDPDWNNTSCHRIVNILDEAGNDVANDISLEPGLIAAPRAGNDPAVLPPDLIAAISEAISVLRERKAIAEPALAEAGDCCARRLEGFLALAERGRS